MPAKRTTLFKYGSSRQHGVALLVLLVILVIGAAILLVSSLSSSALQRKRDKITGAALMQAKEALIGYAASLALTPSGASRPGDLPCPDVNNDGIPDTPCNGNALGRLPWKTLGLADLRDGSGERLWYAVSSNFKNNPRTPLLNSDTSGTISVSSSDGNLQYDGGAGGTGVAAVIIAPGAVLTRTDKTTAQDRSSAGINTASNYLDIATVNGNTEDNANFTDGSSANGFIQGSIKDSNGNVILNDQLLAITQDNIMQVAQKRVAAEVKQCLNQYASDPQNVGRYPWAAPTNNFPNYQDQTNQLFGRIPDTPFINTCLDSGGNNFSWSGNDCSHNPTTGMKNTWTGNCNINSASGWWLNWKEMVFYGLAHFYRPINPLNPPAANGCASAGECLMVNPPSSAQDKLFVAIAAGKTLSGQARSSSANKGALSNYLEGANTDGATPFQQSPPSTTFNDTAAFQ